MRGAVQKVLVLASVAWRLVPGARCSMPSARYLVRDAQCGRASVAFGFRGLVPTARAGCVQSAQCRALGSQKLYLLKLLLADKA